MWLAIIGALAAFASGSYLGYEYASGQCAKAEVKQVAVAEEKRAVVTAGDRKQGAKSAAATAKRQVRAEKVTKEVVEHATSLPDKPDCALAPERVSNINAAFGLDTDQRGEADAVPGPKPPAVGSAPGGGAVGGGDGFKVPRVPTKAAGPVGRGAPAAGGP